MKPSLSLFISLSLVAALFIAAPRGAAAPDGTARQTAKPFTGSALEFDTPGRDHDLQIQSVMDEMGMRPGSVVADIGAGGGWFTVRAAKRVGARGIVYAEEILPKYTSFIATRAANAGFHNVRTILGTTSNPELPRNSLDSALILNAYHEFGEPLAMLRHIKAALKVGGRLAIIERDSPDLRSKARIAYAKTGKIKQNLSERPDLNPNTDDHRLAREVVERETALIGFQRMIMTDLGGDNYLIVVKRVR